MKGSKSKKRKPAGPKKPRYQFVTPDKISLEAYGHQFVTDYARLNDSISNQTINVYGYCGGTYTYNGGSALGGDGSVYAGIAILTEC